MRNLSPVLILAVALAACSSEPESPNSAAPVDATTEATEGATVPAATPTPLSSPTPVASPTAAPTPAETPAPGKTLALEGLGALRIGEAVPRGSGWAERGAQIDEGCRTVSSPTYPGVYAIVTEGKVRRITVGQRSDVKLVEGIGVGSSEQAVRQWFGGFRAEPHKYEDRPAKYLTAPNAASGDPAVRFEIGQDGKVSLIHVGTMPVLGYVEGCA